MQIKDLRSTRLMVALMICVCNSRQVDTPRRKNTRTNIDRRWYVPAEMTEDWMTRCWTLEESPSDGGVEVASGRAILKTAVCLGERAGELAAGDVSATTGWMRMPQLMKRRRRSGEGGLQVREECRRFYERRIERRLCHRSRERAATSVS